jgi:hypothetical protein
MVDVVTVHSKRDTTDLVLLAPLTVTTGAYGKVKKSTKEILTPSPETSKPAPTLAVGNVKFTTEA